MALTTDEIVERLDRLAQWGEESATGSELAEEVRNLADLIRPKSVTFREVHCGLDLSHADHVWEDEAGKRYCPGS